MRTRRRPTLSRDAKGQRRGHRLPGGGTARDRHQLQQGRQRSGVSLMPVNAKTRLGVALLVAALTGLAALPCRAQTQAAEAPDDWVGTLAVSAAPSDLDVAALKEQAAGRIHARAKGDAHP